MSSPWWRQTRILLSSTLPNFLVSLLSLPEYPAIWAAAGRSANSSTCAIFKCQHLCHTLIIATLMASQLIYFCSWLAPRFSTSCKETDFIYTIFNMSLSLLLMLSEGNRIALRSTAVDTKARGEPQSCSGKTSGSLPWWEQLETTLPLLCSS